MSKATRLVGAALAFAAIALASCGRQVTPDRTNVTNAGTLDIKFDTAGPLNFNSYYYLIVFNTSGSGGEPYANVFQTSFKNYSYAFLVGGSTGTFGLQLLQYVLNGSASNPLTAQPVAYNPVLTRITQNSPTEFEINFNRGQLANPAGVTPVPPSGTLWYVNFFVLNHNQQLIDAFGQGINDTSFSLALDTTALINGQFQGRPAGFTAPSDPSATIYSGTFTNVP